MKFASHIQYADDPATANELRPRHRAYLSGLFEQGKLILAGPFTDSSGALFIHEAADAAEVQELIEADPFAVGGMFATVDTRPWKPVFTQADALQVTA
jgi:uncharacterized protein YciI